MKITKLTQQQKNTERVNVFIDGKYTLSLTLNELLEEQLKVGLEIDEPRLQGLKKRSDEGKIRAKTLDWVLRRPRSVRELKDYLFRKKIDTALSLQLIEEMQQKQYVDDERFCRWFLEQRSRQNKSRTALRAELQAKGISATLINNVLADQKDEQDEQNSLKRLIDKHKHKTKYQDRNKFIKYLASKGFRYQDIQAALSDFES
jgi:regulatory protein